MDTSNRVVLGLVAAVDGGANDWRRSWAVADLVQFPHGRWPTRYSYIYGNE